MLDRSAPSPNDFAAVKLSIVAIHFGISASSPAFGRDFHCLIGEEQEQGAEEQFDDVDGSRRPGVGVIGVAGERAR